MRKFEVDWLAEFDRLHTVSLKTLTDVQIMSKFPTLVQTCQIEKIRKVNQDLCARKKICRTEPLVGLLTPPSGFSRPDIAVEYIERAMLRYGTNLVGDPLYWVKSKEGVQGQMVYSNGKFKPLKIPKRLKKRYVWHIGFKGSAVSLAFATKREAIEYIVKHGYGML